VDVDGTSFAAPFVAATAALILGREPGLSPDEVAARILDSADPSPDGPRSTGYGAGILNPYRAVTEERPAAGPTLPAAVPVEPRAATVADGTGRRAGRLAAAGAALAGLLLLAGVVVPRGARRRWRPGRG